MQGGGRRGCWFQGMAFVGVVLLCCGCCGGTGPPATRAAPTATATATPSPSETPVPVSPTDTIQPTAMATATPEPTLAEECTWSAAYVADVTIPDGTRLEPGSAFVKTWRVRNAGTCDWEGVRLAFGGGEQMGAAEAVDVLATVAGEEVDVSVEMVAPESPGNYRATWNLCSGEMCFSQVMVMIVSGEPVVATPVPTSVPEATEVAEPTAPSSPGYPPGVWLCPGGLEGAVYVGSTTSNKFHSLGCRYASEIGADVRLCFASREAAVGYGYEPCGVCDP